jgi:hypothetical protein
VVIPVVVSGRNVSVIQSDPHGDCGVVRGDVTRTLGTHGTPLARILARFESEPVRVGEPSDAERALAELRDVIREAEVEHFAGRFTPDAAAIFSDWIEVAEGYVRDRDRLREAGWDATELVRQLARLVRETVSVWVGGLSPNGGLRAEQAR